MNQITSRRTDSAKPPVLVPGKTCWRMERADRFAVIVDAADYFAALRSSILKARRRVLLIGWDFDTRIKLERERSDSKAPEKLGKLLGWLVDERPDLEVFVLRWDLSIIDTFGRGTTPVRILDWITDKRMHFKLDGAHPAASAHHQKVVVIDDKLAFCGGIDITGHRWDTREHLDDDPRRVGPTLKRPYGPWHDATTAVDGDVARALGELARSRWKRATGEDIEPPSPIEGDPWPDGVSPTFENVQVAIARTIPVYAEQEEVREIEALYLAAIRGAERSVYIESQYFASRRIAEAVARRMGEPGGPEIVVVNPQASFGWLEEEAMGTARARLFKMIGEVDRGRRFRIYNPMTAGGEPIYVHAKILAVDDRLLRVGSSNLNNRSMGFDTECDLAVEAEPGPAGDKVRGEIIRFRNDLLAEHLGSTPEIVADAIRSAGGSLIGAIEGLRGEGRTLSPFQPPETDAFGEALADNALFDPERASQRLGRVRRWTGRLKRRLLGEPAAPAPARG
ncbi:MAG: phospholipase [Rhizobiales bacterium]|nr:phospholipase [Hyphomicrobiales bacterium]